MKVFKGDIIRIPAHYLKSLTVATEFEVVEFRNCLGIYETEEAKVAGDLTPLCTLYEPSPASTSVYLTNYGSYETNMVPVWEVVNSVHQFKHYMKTIEGCTIWYYTSNTSKSPLRYVKSLKVGDCWKVDSHLDKHMTRLYKSAGKGSHVLIPRLSVSETWFERMGINEECVYSSSM